jgi:tetratricopeptide (TPR) repeat protein
MLHVGKFITCFLAMLLNFQLALNAQDLKAAINLSESEQYDASHKAFDNLISANPLNGDAYFYYGESWLKQYMVDSNAVSLSDACTSAMLYFSKGIEKVPGEPLNYIGAGRVDILLGKFTDAEANFQKAKDLMPLRGMKYNKSAIPTAKQALAYAKMAEAYLKDPGKKKEELLDIIDNATERDATVPEVYLIKGDIYMNTNEGSNAIIAYNKASELDKTSCKALVKIGQLWVRAKAYTDALEYYKQAIICDSTFAPAYRERAELYGLAQQWENGIKDYKKFIELSGNNFYAKVRYAAFLYMAKKYEECVTAIEELKTIDKDALNKTYNYLNRLEAYSYFNLNNSQNALEAIKTFFQFAKPEKIMTDDYIYYGDIDSKLNNHEEAIEKYLKAVDLDSLNTDLLTKLAKEYNTLKKYAESAVYYEKKISKNKEKPSYQDYYDLGKIYLNMQEYDKADTCFGTVMFLKPDHINSVMYRAQGRAVVDSTSEKGLAKPYYERLATLSLLDSTKYSKYLSTAYDYLRFYYYKQYLINKKCEDAKNCIVYCDKLLAIDPKNEASLESKKAMLSKCPQ